MAHFKLKSLVFIMLFFALFLNANAVMGQDWYEKTNSANFNARYGHTSLEFNNQMYVIGGTDGTNYYNDVWRSSDGETWTNLGNASFSVREGHSAVVYNNQIWVIGGKNSSGNVLKDVWVSGNGTTWTQAGGTIPWSGRSHHTSVVYDDGSGDRIFVIGGVDNFGNGFPEVWDTNDGNVWNQRTNAAAWGNRSRHASEVFGGKMWVIGGELNFLPTNDVWSSSDGINWTQETANAIWTERMNHTSFVYDSKLWVLGGAKGLNGLSDIWYSSDGKNWNQKLSNGIFGGRHSHTSLIFNDGIENRMWIIGGIVPGNGNMNDVWFSSDFKGNYKLDYFNMEYLSGKNVEVTLECSCKLYGTGTCGSSVDVSIKIVDLDFLYKKSTPWYKGTLSCQLGTGKQKFTVAGNYNMSTYRRYFLGTADIFNNIPSDFLCTFADCFKMKILSNGKSKWYPGPFGMADMPNDGTSTYSKIAVEDYENAVNDLVDSATKDVFEQNTTATRITETASPKTIETKSTDSVSTKTIDSKSITKTTNSKRTATKTKSLAINKNFR